MKNGQPKILIAVPLYNHAGTIKELVERCKKVHDDILVIDDGSTDLSGDLLESTGVSVIRHPENLGKGSAIMTAARHALQIGMTHLVTIDADLQHAPEDFPLFKKAIVSSPDTLWVGKRNFTSTSVPFGSRFGREFSNFWFRVQTGRPVGDAQSGFRAYPLFVLDGIKLKENGYAFEVEVLVKSTWAGIKIKDIPISVHYPETDSRISHFSLLRDNLRLTHLNTKLTFRSFLPVPHKKLMQKKHPNFSFFRPLTSIRAFLADGLTPCQMAMAGMAGIVIGTLPLIAVHTLAILIVAGFFRLSKLVAVGASQLCMPPIVPAICIETGYFMTHRGSFLTDISFETLGRQGLDRFLEWVLGSLIIAPALGAISFIVIYITARLISGPDRRK